MIHFEVGLPKSLYPTLSAGAFYIFVHQSKLWFALCKKPLHFVQGLCDRVRVNLLNIFRYKRLFTSNLQFLKNLFGVKIASKSRFRTIWNSFLNQVAFQKYYFSKIYQECIYYCKNPNYFPPKITSLFLLFKLQEPHLIHFINRIVIITHNIIIRYFIRCS